MMGNGRIGYLDLAKGVCICIVMLFHVHGILQCGLFGERVLFSSFMLPPFFFISGLLFKEEESFRTFFVKKVNRLLVPFLFFYMISAVIIPNLLHWAFGMNFESVIGWRSLWAFLWPGEYPNIPLWFLWCLFLMNLLFWVIRRQGYAVALICFCLCLTGICLDRFVGVDVACIVKTFKYIFFFCAGFLLKGRFTDEMRLGGGWKTALLLVVSFAIALIPAVSYRCDSLPVEVLAFCLSGLAGSVFLLILCSFVRHLPVISYLGENSIVIILTHGLLVRAMTQGVIGLAGSIGPHYAVILSWLLMIVAYLLLIPLIKFCLPHFTAQKPLFR